MSETAAVVTECAEDCTDAAAVKTTGVALADAAALAVKSDYDPSTECSFQPENQLKFSAWISNWPWKTPLADNELAYGIEIKGSGGSAEDTDADADADGGGAAEKSATTSFESTDGLTLVSSNDYIRCETSACGSWDTLPTATCNFDGEDDDCCVVRDGVCGPDGCTATTQGSKTIVTYRFLNSTGAAGVCYDPSIGEASTTSPGTPSSAAPAAGMASSLALLAVAAAAMLA